MAAQWGVDQLVNPGTPAERRSLADAGRRKFKSSAFSRLVKRLQNGDRSHTRLNLLPRKHTAEIVHSMLRSIATIALVVADYDEAIAFYRDRLGFDLDHDTRTQAAFLSAGGYHHHLGANSWESAGRGQAPEGSAKLEAATIVLPDVESRDLVARRVAEGGQEPVVTDDGIAVRDPAGNPIVLTV